MQSILNGLRIVEGSAFIAAPSAGMTLAQLGADVIRFDMIGGGMIITAGRFPRREEPLLALTQQRQTLYCRRF